MNGKEYEYTSYLHFIESILSTNSSDQKLEYKCVFCKVKLVAKLGKTRNIKAHLERHRDFPQLIQWFSLYDDSNSTKKKIDEFTVKLVRFFIGSNTAISEFDSPHFRELFKLFDANVPCAKTFAENTLPNVFEMVKDQIYEKLNKAFNVSLICDIWTNKQMHDFKGI